MERQGVGTRGEGWIEGGMDRGREGGMEVEGEEGRRRQRVGNMQWREVGGGGK